MLRSQSLSISEIYVPTRLQGTADPEKLEKLAESLIEEGQTTPIQVRQGKGRYVLVTGLHRLEALRALGETTIEAVIVQARSR